MRPNILWICADDFSHQACGAYGSPIARTPNLDRLAASGLCFERAYCTCPLSTPSRQSFFTGRYPRSIGVTLSPTPLPADEVTLPEVLRAAGYRTASFGKTHYYSPRPDEFDLRVDRGEYLAWLGQKGRSPLPAGVDVLGPWRPFHDEAAVWLNSMCWPYPAMDDDMIGTFWARQAAAYLRAPPKGPFFVYLSFWETHSPFSFPVEYRASFRPDDFSPPEVSEAEAADMPLVFRSLDREQRQGILAAYHTCASFMDRNVGLALDALEASGRADDTIVVFTSDHGYMLGQRGRFEKHCCYEPAVRVPFVLRCPGLTRPGGRPSALVQLHDIAPTLLELCGVEAPGAMQGSSLAGLLAGGPDQHRHEIFVEYSDNAEGMVLSSDHKLIYSASNRVRHDGYAPPSLPSGPRVELYDLRSDPDERVDLAGRAEHAPLVASLTHKLAEHMLQTSRSRVDVPAGANTAEILASCLLPVESRWIRR